MCYFKKYHFKDVIDFLPGLNIQVTNFEIWLQDAWDIIMFNGKYSKECEFSELGTDYKGAGDILIWIASFYTIYSEFQSLITNKDVHEIDYVDFYNFLSDWDSFLSAYLAKNIQIAVNKYIFLKDHTCQVPLFNHNDCVTVDVPERLDYLYNYYFYKQDDITSISYDVLEEEIKRRTRYIKNRIYRYFNSLYSTYFEFDEIKEVIIQFMYGLHWFLNYTTIDQPLLIDKIVTLDDNKEIFKHYLLGVFKDYEEDIFKECPCLISFDFNLFSKLKDYVSYIFLEDRVLKRTPNIIQEKRNLDDWCVDQNTPEKAIKEELEITIQERIETVIRTYNWIESWQHIK